jgi:hypothetical protein
VESDVSAYKVWVARSVYDVEASSAEEALVQKTAVGEEGYVFTQDGEEWFGVRGARGHRGVAWAAGRYELLGDVVHRLH